MQVIHNIDYKNYLMLTYYRNPINHIFFNEGVIVVAMQSFGNLMAWEDGISLDELYQKCHFLSNLLKREEVLQEEIYKSKREEVFDKLIKKMVERKIIIQNNKDNSKVQFRSSGETFIVFASSLI